MVAVTVGKISGVGDTVGRGVLALGGLVGCAPSLSSARVGVGCTLLVGVSCGSTAATPSTSPSGVDVANNVGVGPGALVASPEVGPSPAPSSRAGRVGVGAGMSSSDISFAPPPKSSHAPPPRANSAPTMKRTGAASNGASDVRRWKVKPAARGRRRDGIGNHWWNRMAIRPGSLVDGVAQRLMVWKRIQLFGCRQVSTRRMVGWVRPAGARRAGCVAIRAGGSGGSPVNRL